MDNTRTKLPALYTYFTIFAMAAGAYLPFINVYLDDIGFTKLEIGFFSALAPLAAMLIQPIFGLAADRAKAKNTVAVTLMAALGGISALFLFLRTRVEIASLMSMWTGVHASLLSVSNAIALEHLQETGQSERYGRVRLCYSLGYAASGGLLGRLVGLNLAWIFPSTAVLCLLSLLPLAFVPRMTGKQAEGERLPWTRIFSYRRLMAMFAFAFLICVSNSLFYTFLPVYFKRLGGSNELYAYSVVFSAVVETPFLLLSGRLIRRYGAERLLVLPAAALLLRWTIVSLAGSPWVIFASNALHGAGFIVLHLTLARYVSDTVHPGLRATGQSLVSIVLFSMSRVAGGLAGGWLSESLCQRLGELPGLRWTFIINAVFIAATGTALLAALAVWRRADGRGAAEEPRQPI